MEDTDMSVYILLAEAILNEFTPDFILFKKNN